MKTKGNLGIFILISAISIIIILIGVYLIVNLNTNKTSIESNLDSDSNFAEQIEQIEIDFENEPINCGIVNGIVNTQQEIDFIEEDKKVIECFEENLKECKSAMYQLKTDNANTIHFVERKNGESCFAGFEIKGYDKKTNDKIDQRFNLEIGDYSISYKCELIGFTSQEYEGFVFGFYLNNILQRLNRGRLENMLIYSATSLEDLTKAQGERSFKYYNFPIPGKEYNYNIFEVFEGYRSIIEKSNCKIIIDYSIEAYEKLNAIKN